MGELGWLVSTRVAADVAVLVFVKGTILLSIVILACHWVRKRSAAYRHRVWVLGLVGLISLPLANLWVPAWGDVGLTYPSETSLLGLEALETPTLTRDADGRRMIVEGEAASPVGLPVQSTLLLLFWAGVTVGLTRLVVDLARVLGFRLTSRTAPSEHPATRLLERERVRAGVRRPVALLIRDREGLAAMIGMVRPAVVLGADVAEMPEDQLRSVLLHELAHIRRGDFLANLLSSVAMVLYWPNPLYWVARRRASLTLEQACDDEVLTRGVTSSDYARVLMHFAVAQPGLSPAMRSTVGFLRLSPTRDRIFSILDGGLDRAPVGTRAGFTTALFAAALVIPIGSIGLLSHLPGTGPTAALVADLSHENEDVRARAARTLGRRGASGVRVAMEALLDDESADVRLAAAAVLEQRGDPASIPAMAHVLTRPFDDGRGEHGFVLKLAIKALGRTDHPDAVAVLEAQLDRPVPQLRRLALEEIALMPTQWRSALPHLDRFAREDPDARNRTYAAETRALLLAR
jgi:beta-lactamase regulating signal transducer with metallopeptidase domain